MLSRRAAWAVTIVAVLTMTVSYIDRATLGVLGETVTKALDISEAEYGWIVAAFQIAYLVGTPLAGWWIDRAGARRGLVVSVLLWSVVAALHAAALGFVSLFALRIALGLAEAPGFPGGAQTVQRVLPEGDRARGFGLLFSGSSIGNFVAPLLAGVLFAAGGWRVAMLGTAAAGLVWLPLWLAVTRSPVVRAQLDRHEPARARVSLATLLRDPIVIRAMIAVFCVAPVVGFLQGFGGKYLTRTYSLTQGEVGQYLWLPPLCLDAGAIAFGDLLSRGVRPRLLVTVAAALAACFGLLPVVDTLWQTMLLLGLAMAGGGAMYTIVTTDMLARVPAGHVSFAGGVLAAAQSIALIVVSPLIGYARGRLGDFELATAALGLLAIPGAIVWLVWRPQRGSS